MTTTTETITGLAVCVDCAMFIANGETPPEMSEDETDAWIESLDDSPGVWVLDCGDDCESSFSSSPCDHCGSRLGGDRHPAAII